MAGSVNKVILVGNLGRDPEVRTMQTGGKVVNLSLATSYRWKDRDGNPQERTEWHRVAIFNERLADVAERYLHKGSKIYLEGALQTRKWTDNQGQDRYVTEVVLQKFRGELVMLDSQGSGPPPATDPGDYGNPKTSLAPHGGEGRGEGAGRSYGDHRNGDGAQPAPTDYASTLDDEIPF